MAIGYLKKVFRAKLNKDGKLNFDKHGYPIFKPNETAGVLHQENGYFVAYRQEEKPGEDYRILKLINIPRGITVSSDGEYMDGRHKMEIESKASEPPFRVYVSGIAANRDAGNDIIMKNYE